MSLKLMLEEAARHYGQKTAIASGNRQLSYASLDEESNKLANGLIKLGIKKGDRVAMLLPSCPEFVTTYFGIVKTGAIPVLLDSKYKIAELTSLFNDFQPKALVSESRTLEPLVPDLPRFKSIGQVIDLNPQPQGQFTSYQEILSSSLATRIKTEPGPDDIALITYTSGPSLQPRGVMLTHQALMREIAATVEAFQQTYKDKLVLFALPLHHVFGLVSVVLTSVYKGNAVIMLPGLSISTLIETIEKEKITMFFGVPFVFSLLVREAEKEGIKNNLSSMRLWCSAGAPLSVNLVRQFQQYYGRPLFDAWGLTEATCLVTAPPVDGTGPLGAVGKAMPGWEVMIVDNSGEELRPNRSGEVIVRGPMMKGYYNNQQATAEVIRDGWLYTGDIAELDEAGNLFITGRKKDTIIIKGQNIYPVDIESVLSQHPKVAEVAVIGTPDELRGEAIWAIIRLKKGETATEHEMEQFCLERIANYKVPKQVIFADALPRDTAGKIDKERIREQLSIPLVFPGVSTRY